MKKQTILKSMLAIGLMASISNAQANTGDLLIPGLLPGGRDFNPELVSVREEPGRNAEVIVQDVQTKTIEVAKEEVTFKWTELGYGAMTHKVLIQELANHTVFNHRNDGEEGPCLASRRRFFQDVNKIKSKRTNASVVISIKIQNQYRINREKKICKVSMLEDVRTIIDGEEFTHLKRKEMGYRYIGDCPQS